MVRITDVFIMEINEFDMLIRDYTFCDIFMSLMGVFFKCYINWNRGRKNKLVSFSTLIAKDIKYIVSWTFSGLHLNWNKLKCK